MQEKIQNVLQRNSFRDKMICIGVVIIIANTAFMFQEQMGKKSCIRLGRSIFCKPLKENLVLTDSVWFCTKPARIPSPIFPHRKTV